ncbi:uncharacterized protein MYCFIDRAFT_86999 [Pseudocercospora fijiensis CIRAD86]|uniref:Uncharacterized protein n=1 Tax=Pseudocercospora fijiensis (strain CIRAD86) TaxID=383855 RepID=N1QCU4_PSEFD|nr:uncharacterized protein MYCFIDRAFT_86999 [Pseudocercospora fijiensis CIRAD86]EME89687.1 hypothetical protein MYCFIDRAFT_86999 [Pseudocercospora fijiensis CIRAD86]
MQFKAIVIALVAVGSAVATPIDQAAQAPDATMMLNEAAAYAAAHVGQVPDYGLIQAAKDLKAAQNGYPYFSQQYEPFPCCFETCSAPKPWRYWDYFNAYCYQKWPASYPVWNQFCFSPTIQIQTCSGLLGCLL